MSNYHQRLPMPVQGLHSNFNGYHVANTSHIPTYSTPVLVDIAETFQKTVKNNGSSFDSSEPCFSVYSAQYSEVQLYLRHAPISTSDSLGELKWSLFAAMVCDLVSQGAVTNDFETFINAYQNSFTEHAQLISKLRLLYPDSPEQSLHAKTKFVVNTNADTWEKFCDFCSDHNLRHVQRAIMTYINVQIHQNSHQNPNYTKQALNFDVSSNYKEQLRNTLRLMQSQQELTRNHEQRLQSQIQHYAAQVQHFTGQVQQLEAQPGASVTPQIQQQIQALQQQIMQMNATIESAKAECSQLLGVLQVRNTRQTLFESNMSVFLRRPQHEMASTVPLPGLNSTVARTKIIDLLYCKQISNTDLPSVLSMNVIYGTNQVLCSNTSCHGTYTAVSLKDKSVRIWKLKPGNGSEHHTTLATLPSDASSAAVNIYADSLVFHEWPFQPAALHGQSLRCCLCVGTECVCSQRAFRQNIGSRVRCMEFSHNEEYLLLGCLDGKVKLIQLSTMIVLYTYQLGTHPVTSLAWSYLDAYFAVGLLSGRVGLCVPHRKDFLRIWRPPTPATTLVFHPNAQLLLVGVHNNIYIYDVATYLGRVVNAMGSIRDIAVSPVGDTCAAVTTDGKVLAFNLIEDKEIFLIDGRHEFIAPEYNANNAKYYTQPRDTSEGEQLVRPKGTQGTAHEGAIYSCAFSACGKYLSTGGQDGTVKLWSVDKALPTNLTQTPTMLLQQSKLIDTRLVKTFYTKHTQITKVKFTPRNLLITMGSFANPQTS